jgi:hypothetical protein
MSAIVLLVIIGSGRWIIILHRREQKMQELEALRGS